MKPKLLKIIVNPHAHRDKAKSQVDAIRREMSRLGVEIDLSVTDTADEGSKMARQAVEAGHEIIVAAGGDGTINRVLNGLMQAANGGPTATLGILPIGTANDLAAMIGIPLDLKAACQRLALAETRTIDVGVVNGHFFDNNSAIGLESTVTTEAEKISWIPGDIRYLMAALKTIILRPVWNAHIEWDGGTFKGPLSLVSVGNSTRTGGAFFMTPNALIDDGLLDVVFAPRLSRFRLLQLLTMTFSGRHIDHDAVTSVRTASIHIRIEPTPLHADGEIIDRAATEIKYSVRPQQLRVII